MTTKTPQFDAALDEYFTNLKLDEKGGQWRTCRFSDEKFYVRPEDVEFCRKIRVPLPTLSPLERRRKRIASYNAYKLFKTTSAYSGKKIVSNYPPLSPFKIYEYKIWLSDVLDPMQYQRLYDPTQPFWGQFRQLQLAIPRPALFSDPTNVNSDYTNFSKNLKNCYLTFDQSGGEDLYYHQCCLNDKNCIECWAIDNSDTCYESKISDNLFKCFWCEECKNSTESYFLWDCRNCDYCFMSSCLRNKKYYFRNEYIGREEYERRISMINFGDFETIRKLKKEFWEMKMATPRKPNWNEKSVNVFGDYIRESRNIYFGLWVFGSENLSYSEGLVASRDSYDVLGGANNELCYELANAWAENDYGCKFSMEIDNCRGVEYCDLCTGCSNCFGCIGLTNKSFCIFNKQYEEEEYWLTLDQIKASMLDRGEYGEFFPPELLPVPYRTSAVVYFYGFEDFDNAQKYGYDVSLVEENSEETAAGQIVKSEDLPGDIKDVGDDIPNKIIFDTKNNKKFRIIKQELNFYRKYNIPLPREHPDSRVSSTRKQFGLVVNFYDRPCAKCGKTMQTSYAPERPEKNIWCEPCYLSEIG